MQLKKTKSMVKCLKKIRKEKRYNIHKCVPSEFSMIYHGSTGMVSAGVRSVKSKKQQHIEKKRKTHKHTLSMVVALMKREPTISSSVESKVGQRA